MISVERPTTKNIMAINRKVPPTNPDQMLGLNVPLVKNVHNKIDPKKTLNRKKKIATLEKKDNGL
jgi:hypothetical protein